MASMSVSILLSIISGDESNQQETMDEAQK